ncbi:MAG: 2-amino-4-hydroxy-6-hydroxymethyldihydropteridine diphosphokinase [Phycisphaerales bacterium]
MNGDASHDVCIALGANLGDRAAAIERAIDAIRRRTDAQIIARSPMERTRAVGPGKQPDYLNAAIRIQTTLEPRPLLDALLAIERDLGRVRDPDERWGPRTIDLDILLIDDMIIDEPGLTVPHPRLHERRFVLEPLAAVAAERMHPTLKRTIRALLDDLPLAADPPAPKDHP